MRGAVVLMVSDFVAGCKPTNAERRPGLEAADED
jgi:hypothetical protein